MEQEILGILPDSYPWKEYFHYVPTIDSTNSQLKILALQGAPQGTVLVAGEQTGGRGRLGRSFHSPAGTGVYLSMLLRPDCAPDQLMHLTCAVADAMVTAVEKAAGFRPGIKWTNDLVYGKRKLGGILTELGLDGGRLDYVIIGVGINCLQGPEDFPPELRDMAASLSMIAGHPVSPARLAAEMMQALHTMSGTLLTEKDAMLRRYRQSCITLGTEVSLVRGEEIRHGKALDIDEDGGLVVEFAPGRVETVSCGEISVRGMYGYV